MALDLENFDIISYGDFLEYFQFPIKSDKRGGWEYLKKNLNAIWRLNQIMVTSTVLSITKQGGFQFLHGRFFSVIFVDNVY